MFGRVTARATLSLWVTMSLISGLSACGLSSSSTAAPPLAEDSFPPTAAIDCSQSAIKLITPPTIPSGSILAETDSTRTSLLIKNTGDQTVLVIPRQNTALQPTPDINPQDFVDSTALKALSESTFLETDPNLPLGTPLNSVYIVPPGYGVCGTVPEVGEYPYVTIQQDRVASATWFVLHAVAQSLSDRLRENTFEGSETIQAMATCANGTASLASSRPDLASADLYANVMQTSAGCYKSYKAVFENSEEAQTAVEDASKTREDVVSLLDRAPDLLKDVHFILDLIHKS
jgi:hypothetical protein